MGKTKIQPITEEAILDIKPAEAEVLAEEAPVVEETKPEKTAKKSKTAKKETKQRSKKYQTAHTQIDANQKYNLTEAVKLAKEGSYSKFPGTLEVHINTSAKNLRGLAALPFAAGKKIRILAFGKGAEEAGADVVGSDEIIAQIEKGNMNKVGFDIVVTSPEWMPKLARAAKILGPRGLMPNPKNGTITENLSKAVADLQQGKVEYKTQANSQVIHLGVGKTTQPDEEIIANIKALHMAIGKSRVKKMTISPTMGPGVRVDLQSI